MYVPETLFTCRSHGASMVHKARSLLFAGLVMASVFLGGSCEALFDTLTITGPTQVEVGQTILLTATYSTENGGIQDVTTTALWFSWHQSIADWITPGVIQGLSLGDAEIVARYGSPVLEDSHWVKVVASTAGTLTLTPAFLSLSVGNSSPPLAVNHSVDGPIALNSPLLTWSSDTPSVATVIAGVVTAGVTTGIAIITCSYAGASGTVEGTATVSVN